MVLVPLNVGIHEGGEERSVIDRLISVLVDALCVRGSEILTALREWGTYLERLDDSSDRVVLPSHTL